LRFLGCCSWRLRPLMGIRDKAGQHTLWLRAVKGYTAHTCKEYQLQAQEGVGGVASLTGTQLHTKGGIRNPLSLHNHQALQLFAHTLPQLEKVWQVQHALTQPPPVPHLTQQAQGLSLTWR
jgi:hypothetical protein